jgi:hypothetical protein
VEHVLRYDADPTKCYEDGRVEKILENLDEIGLNLKNYEEVNWR